MIKGGKGGANTQTGLAFERRTDILLKLAGVPGYRIERRKIFYKEKLVAESFKQAALYKFLKEHGVDFKTKISKRLMPDEAIVNYRDKTLYIVEMKFQKVAGSVDEKLQTCDFKKKQYVKLMSDFEYDVEYIYILSDWFQKPVYQDVLSYIKEVGCHYYFNILPLSKIGLPTPK